MSASKSVSFQIKRVTLVVGLIGLPLVLATGCASQQQEDSGDIISNTENGDAEAANAENGGEAPNQEAGNNAEAGSGEEGGTPTNESAELPAGEEGGAPTTDAAPAAGVEDLQTAAPAPAPAATAAAPAPAASAPAAPTSEQAPIAGGRVRYVKEGGAKVTTQATGGEIVRTLEQGDHPLTWEEGGAYKLGNAMYVAKDSMSDTGIPRAGFVKPAN